MKRRPTTVMLSLAIAFVLTACSAGSQEAAGDRIKKELDAALSKGWVDSNISGSVKADVEYRPQDDFAAAKNKAWKQEIGDRYYGVFQDVSDEVLNKMKKAVTDESIPGEEAEVLRKYYALSSDWDYRNSQGVEPLKPYIADIESISSMDELYAFFGDLERNPLALAPISVDVMDSYHIEQYPDINLTYIDVPKLSLQADNGQTYYDKLNAASTLEMYEAIENKVMYMLEQLGYTQKDAKNTLKNCLKWEKKVASSTVSMELEDLEEGTKTRDEAAKIAGDFPLIELLDAWGFTDAEYIVVPEFYTKRLSRLCNKRYLEKIKDYMVVNYCLNSAMYLDRTTFEKLDELSKSRSSQPMDIGQSEQQKEDSLQFEFYISRTAMLGALNKTYVENYFDDATTAELTGLTKDIIDAYNVIFAEEPWLSDEGKAACLDKLNNIGIHIAYQSFEVLDYSKAPFKSKEEGGSFLDAYYAMERYQMYHTAFLSGQKFRRDYWDPIASDGSTTMTNAFYNPATNGIYICAGICEPCSYAPDMTYEEKLAGLCAIVGHEITHGFDRDGALYDKNGLKNSWMPYKDQVAFSDLNDKVASYYSTLTPYPGSGLYNGSNLTGEATADMGGLKACLYLASKVPDFDYDLFFSSYARIWRVNIPLEAEKNYFASDPHPLAFYRINVGVQQFDEFYETYGVVEGDRMYLEPEKRIKVW